MPAQPAVEIKPEAKVEVPAPAVAETEPVAIVDTETAARDWLFVKESGNQLDSINYQGCYGLGQDCNNVLAAACPDWRTNRDCQLTFWQQYMERRYGSWQKAKAFWLARVPINGRDVGNWW